MSESKQSEAGDTGRKGAVQPPGSQGQRSRRPGLGRGLDALIPELGIETPSGAVSSVPISQVVPNPYQPRLDIDDEELEELASSIKVHGVIQPLLVSPASDGNASVPYVLIAGERRWKAAQLAGLTHVPVVIKDATAQEMLELAIIENVMRSDLSALEEATAYRQLVEEFNLTQTEIAVRVGKSRASITNTIRLLAAPQAVQDALRAELITEGHARALLSLPSGIDQVALLESIIAKGWTVRETEAAVRRWLEQERHAPPSDSAARDQEVHTDDRIRFRMERALETEVQIWRSKKGHGGSIHIQFNSDEELERLLERLAGDDLF